eukprot:scaffold859_cov234-Ochromonas_danica.AAC.6
MLLIELPSTTFLKLRCDGFNVIVDRCHNIAVVEAYRSYYYLRLRLLTSGTLKFLEAWDYSAQYTNHTMLHTFILCFSNNVKDINRLVYRSLFRSSIDQSSDNTQYYHKYKLYKRLF